MNRGANPMTTPSAERISFKEWIAEAKELLRGKYGWHEWADSIDEEAWKEGYYDDGAEPEEAILEELSYGD